MIVDDRDSTLTCFRAGSSAIDSEGGTGENQRINPHLDFENFVENNNNIGKKFVQILT